MSEYKITYELDGGLTSNPRRYTENEAVALKAPLRPGYSFAGWQGAPSVIPKGSRGDRVLSAGWQSINIVTDPIPAKEGINYGCDDGIAPIDGEKPISAPDGRGSRGENIYVVKTAYTDIKVDGTKDPAYDYGIHLRSDVSNAPEYYSDKDTGFEVYVVKGQDGRLYVFAEVTDPNVIIPDQLWRRNMHHCDGIHLYTEHGLVVVGADHTERKARGAVCESSVVLTEKGYNVEFSINNGGCPFGDGEKISFGFFMCDCVSYESVESHTKNVLRISSALSGKEKYEAPMFPHNDSFVFSDESVTGRELKRVGDGVAKTDDILYDIINGSRKTAIVYGINASAHTVTALRRMLRYFNSFCAPITLICEDSARYDDFDCRIIVGMTGDKGVARLSDETPYNGYSMRIAEESIYLVGWREEAFDAALGLFASALEYVRRGGRTRDLDETYVGAFGAIPGDSIPRIGDIVTVTDAGDGAYCILVKPASAEKHENYLSRLESAGFKLYAENRINTVSFHTYFDCDSVVTVSYDENPDNGNDLRIVVEPRVMTALPPMEKESYKPRCQSSITQISPNRMTYVVKLDSGEFLVADSGKNDQHSYIYDELMRLSDDGKPVVAVWTFSHFHQDHNGGFIEFVQNEEYMKNVTVRSVIYNTPEYQLISLASPLDKRNMSKWESLLDRHGITRYQARTGQKYRFANAELEMLYTYEDLMPFFVYFDRTNPSSFVYMLKIEGQRLVITGDCCAEASSLMVARYGDALKADFVQLPHHGHGDGGTDPEFYNRVNADYVLWPGEPARLSPAEAKACKMAKKYFVMCEGTVTIDLPYKG